MEGGPGGKSQTWNKIILNISQGHSKYTEMKKVRFAAEKLQVIKIALSANQTFAEEKWLIEGWVPHVIR